MSDTGYPISTQITKILSVSLLLIFTGIAGACNTPPPEPTVQATPTSSATSTPTASPSPTSTDIPEPTPTATQTVRSVPDDEQEEGEAETAEPVTPTPEIEPTVEETEKPGTIEPTSSPPDIEPTVEKTEEAEKVLPKIGEITFALGMTNDHEPISPNYIFREGISEVHAIFEYSGMTPETTWEQIWYRNDEVVSQNKESWSSQESGIFDYHLDNEGKPLPPGDWVLELYVDDQLQSLGVFIINEIEPAEIQKTYKLAYTKCEEGHHNIYVANTDGTDEQLLVTRGAGPSWSPDGELIFFYGEEGVDRQIRDEQEYLFEGISNGLVAVSSSPFPDEGSELELFQRLDWKQGTARWTKVSPDGEMIAYDAKPSGNYRIYFVGTSEDQTIPYEIVGEQASWSPDGQELVYRSGRNGSTGLWISNRDDTEHTQITFNGSDSFPVWSPDGQMIAFSRETGSNVDIYSADIEGNNLRRLTNAPGHDTLPIYTPEGEIIFRSARTGSWGIWKMAGDGSEQAEIISEACVGTDWAYSRMDVLD